jgi:glucose dehydrogenase
MESSPHPLRRLARIVFFTFILVFTVSRVLVILIMTRRIPDFFLHAGGTHVHHLNYGIFLLSTVGALLLFAPLSDRQKQLVACAYGFGMALTFDEFGMWLHLGGGYWQRASYDAVIVVTAILGLISFAPRWNRVGPRHYAAAGVTLASLAVFCFLSFKSLNFVEKRVGDRLRNMEENGPQ